MLRAMRNTWSCCEMRQARYRGCSGDPVVTGELAVIYERGNAVSDLVLSVMERQCSGEHRSTALGEHYYYYYYYRLD